MSMLIWKLWLSCRDAEKLSWFCKAELLKQVSQHGPQTPLLPLQLIFLTCPTLSFCPHPLTIPLVHTSPMQGCGCPPSPPATTVLFLSQPLCFLKCVSASDVFSCNKTIPVSDIPVSEQTSSTFLFSRGMDELCHLMTPLSQEGTPSVMKRDLFLSEGLTKLQCWMETEALTVLETPWIEPMWNTSPVREDWRIIYTFPLMHSWEGRSQKTAPKFVKGCIFQSTSNSGKLSNVFANYLKIHPLLKTVSAVILEEKRLHLHP